MFDCLGFTCFKNSTKIAPKRSEGNVELQNGQPQQIRSMSKDEIIAEHAAGKVGLQNTKPPQAQSMRQAIGPHRPVDQRALRKASTSALHQLGLDRGN